MLKRYAVTLDAFHARSLIRATLAMAAVAACATACRPKFPLCKTDSDCVDADANHGAVHCLDGQCQECKADTDCTGGKTCQSMRCEAPAVSTAVPAAPAAPPSAPDIVAQCHLD